MRHCACIVLLALLGPAVRADTATLRLLDTIVVASPESAGLVVTRPDDANQTRVKLTVEGDVEAHNFVGDGRTLSGVQQRVSGDCPGGSAIRRVHSDGQVECETPLAGPPGPPGADSTVAGPPGTDASLPSGGIIMWSGSIDSVPAGWVLCDGQNGTPQLQNRFIVGAGPGSTSFYAPGDTGGLANVALTVAQMPPHKHDTTIDGNHVRDHDGADTFPHGGAGNHRSSTFTMSNAGGGELHENRPPYYALAYIMKT